MSSARGSFSSGPLRVAVIGSQTEAPESANPYTVYRTVVTFEGQCYERLLRYSQFLWFYKNLKFIDKSPLLVAFPKKKWSRKASLEDDVIEERQVKLNEIMTELGRKQLTTQSEQCLMKLLKIGKYDDGTGRMSDFSMLKSSFFRSERSTAALEMVPEEEEGDKNRRKESTSEIGGSATLVATSLAFPAIPSNATTVLTEEERSVIGSQPRATDFDQEDASMMAAQEQPGSVPRKSMSSIPPSSNSDLVLNRPQLKANQSLPPSRRSKRDELSNSGNTPASAPNVVGNAPGADTSARSSEPFVEGSLSPEKKYRERISTQLKNISRLFSESEAETEDMESSRSIQMHQSVPLTA